MRASREIVIPEMDKFADEEAIATAVFAYSGDIYSMSDVLRFLNINDFNKPNTVRLICWLVAMKLIPVERTKWIAEIHRLSNYYKRCCERYCEDCYMTPLDSIRGSDAGLIRDTINDAFPWFEKVGKVFGVREEDMASVQTRMQRIFTILMHDASGFSYAKGYEYFGYYSFLVAYVFGKKGGLPLSFAEALGSHIARCWISIIAFTKHLDDMKANHDTIEQLKNLRIKFCPTLLPKLNAANIDFFEFNHRWERCLFAEQHAPWNLLLIWDQVLFHLSDYRTYITFLIIGHYREMLLADVDFKSEESINNMKWDAMKIIDDVESLIEDDKRNISKMFWQMMCPCFPSLRRFF